MGRRRTAKEIAELVENFRTSGMTKTAYCQQAGLALSTLGRHTRQGNGNGQLVRVNVETSKEPRAGFALVLGNGRRIESGWSFPEAGLAQLIRVADAV